MKSADKIDTYIISENERIKFVNYSDEGIKIHCLCRFLYKMPCSLTQEKVISHYSSLFESKSSYIDLSINPIRDKFEITTAKKKKSGERIREIVDMLETFCRLLGYIIVEYPSRTSSIAKLIYKVTEPLISLPKKSKNYNSQSLEEYGLVGIVHKNPVESKSFQEDIKIATKINIIQSSLYNSHKLLELIEYYIINGFLNEAYFLLGQPFSNVAEVRAETYNVKNQNKFDFFNNELNKSISSILALALKYKDKTNNKTGKEIRIRVRLYYQVSSFSLYQFYGVDNLQLSSIMGIFWKGVSSYPNPHFHFIGNTGKLVTLINNHFNRLWNDTSSKEFDKMWHELIQNQNTIKISKGDNFNDSFKFLKKAYRLRGIFPKKVKTNNSWIYFKCFYYNFSGEPRQFLLQIDYDNNICKISITHTERVYFGIIIKIHNSYSIILHSTEREKTRRIINLSIPTGGLKLNSKKNFFALYSNNDIETGSPYSQLMYLTRIVSESEFINTELSKPHYIPFLKEKKLGLSTNLWHEKSSTASITKDDYIYNFSSSERGFYYETINREILTAKSEVYFLGSLPIESSFENNGILKSYYETHRKILDKKSVTIYRIIIDDHIDNSFVNFLKLVLKSDVDTSKYKVFTNTHRQLPVSNDLILIDPEERNGKKAIISYLKKKRNSIGSVPLRMEIIKNDHNLIDILYSTCLEYLTNKIVTKISLQKLIESVN